MVELVWAMPPHEVLQRYDRVQCQCVWMRPADASPPLRRQIAIGVEEFAVIQLEDRSFGEKLLIPFDRLVECPDLHAIELGELLAEQDMLAANGQDHAADVIG